ncbi:MAG: polysaccharide deacetylase family protein [Armatimonas sp.]
MPPTKGSQGAKETNYRRLAEIAAQDDAERQKGIKLLRVVSGSPNLPYIALTFDDGPHGEKTSQLLDLLKQLHCPSTFFLVGSQARRHPELVQRIAVEGHEIGNHTFNHYRLNRIPTEEIANELNRTRDLLKAIVGAPSRLFRPPGGEYSPEILKIVERNGYTTVLWTDDPADYKLNRTAADIKRLVIRDITPGGIILLHDGIRATVQALPSLVRTLRDKGYIFVTVSELIQRGGGLDLVKNISFSRTSARER